jgi:hypothetical protein
VTALNPKPAEKSQDAFGLSQPTKTLSRITAHVVSVANVGKAIVVHLDNGQVWREVPEGTLTTKLKPDDPVTIDKGLLGAYWLRGPAAGLIKVKRTQ